MNEKILHDKAPFPQARISKGATCKALERLLEAIAKLKRELE
ncbi:hypothetical protein [Aneurinibacillus terranovensis]|nr:hypothetical protein [Aneurinibacillus terranovensis]